MEHITLKDIAKALNVSISTVSRAMNNAFDINKDTRERILQKAKVMGYKPNPMARNLHDKMSKQIGVVVPELYSDFFPKVIKGIQRILSTKGYQLLIVQCEENSEIEFAHIKQLERYWVDGLIISLSGQTDHIDYYNSLYNRGLPMVFFNRVSDELLAPRVIFNDTKWAHLATEHLIRQGRKRIVHLAGKTALSLSRDRIIGFKQAMHKFNISIEQNQIIDTGFTKEDGYNVMTEILNNSLNPDAIFAVNDAVALGAVKALKEHKFRIPKDVAIVGFTESDWSSYITPGLTSVEQPAVDIGEQSAKLLLQQIAKLPLEKHTIELNGHLNIRASSL